MSDIDPALQADEAPSRSAHPTWILRFFESIERPQRPAGEEQLEESERHVSRHVGSLKLAPSGKLEMDIRSASLQGLLSLNVFPVMEADAWIMGDPDSIDRLEEHCAAATLGRFTLERVKAEEDEETLREAAYGSVSPDWGGPAAPWSPLPLQSTRQYIQQHQDAQIEIEFPTVYEEDRGKKIQDLTVAEQQKVISHRRYSEQVAKELGFAQYNYDEEQDDIKLHPSPAQPEMGMAPSAGPTGAPGGGGRGQTRATFAGGPAASASLHNRVRATIAGDGPVDPGSRPGMGAEDRAAFRADQDKVTEAAVRAVDRLGRDLGDRLDRALRDIREAARPAPLPPPVLLEAAEPLAPAPIIVPPAQVHIHEAAPAPAAPADVTVTPAPPTPVEVHVHTPPRGPRVIEYDAEGRVVGIKDAPPAGEQ